MTKNSTLSVVVFAPVSQPFVVEFEGRFDPTAVPEMRPEVVGLLSPVEDDGADTLIRLRSEVVACGCTVDIIVRSWEPSPGHVGCLLAYRINAPTMEAAKSLPGFFGIYEYLGAQRMPSA